MQTLEALPYVTRTARDIIARQASPDNGGGGHAAVRARVFRAILYQQRSFYQDGLGTNVGKALKERDVLLRKNASLQVAPQYILNPVAIGIRGDPFGDRPNEADVRMPMANADPRSRAMFGAAYFVGYLANLGLQEGTQVDAVALGDAMGMRKRHS